MGKGSQQTVFLRGRTNGQQVHGKGLNVTNHQGNAYQNHSDLYVTPVGMAIIEDTRYNKCWQRCGEKGTLVYCRWECKLIQLYWKKVQKFVTKL